MIYDLSKKNFDVPKPHKTPRQKFLTAEQVQAVLDAVSADADNPFQKRDHCMIFLGFRFALRIGEAVIIERDTFRDIHDIVAYIRTLKQAERVKVTCRSCDRVSRVSATRGGKLWKCPRCEAENRVPVHIRGVQTAPPERVPPSIENAVIEYVQDYMANEMRPDQRWFFESTVARNKKGPNGHMCIESLRKIFAHYCAKAGLDSIYSWHSMRHGRGVLLWEMSENQVLVRDMLRQKSTASTDVYLHMSPRRAAQISQQLEQLAPVQKTQWAANPPGKR